MWSVCLGGDSSSAYSNQDVRVLASSILVLHVNRLSSLAGTMRQTKTPLTTLNINNKKAFGHLPDSWQVK